MTFLACGKPIMSVLSIAEVKSHFSEMLSRASSGERIVIRRRTRPIAALIGIEELKKLEQSANLGRQLAFALGQDPEILDKIADGKLHPAMAAAGLWKDEEDLADLEAEIYANRRRSIADEPISRPTVSFD